MLSVVEWLHQDDRVRVMKEVQGALDDIAPFDMEFRAVWPDGSLHWLAGKGSVVRDETGKPIRMLGVNFDVTMRKHAEESLRQSEARLSHAERIAQLGHWDWNVVTNESHSSIEFRRIFGSEFQESGFSYEGFLSSVHAEEMERINTEVAESLDCHNNWTFQYRIVLSDGTEHHIEPHAEIDPDENGRPLRMFGVVQDLTDSNGTGYNGRSPGKWRIGGRSEPRDEGVSKFLNMEWTTTC
jgi:PAS domain-containing protein